jgi:amino acid permease
MSFDKHEEPLIDVSDRYDDDDDDYYSDDEDLENKTEEFYANESGTGTFAGSVANLVNSAIGAGVLGLPIAFQFSGAILGLILTGFFAAIIAYSLHVVGRAQKFTNSGTYQESVAKLIGPKAEVSIIILQLMFLVGACIGFLDIIPDQLVPVMSQWTSPDSIVAKREVIILAVAFCIILPLMFVKNIAKLWPLATFSVFAIIFCLGMIMARSIPEMGKVETVMGEPSPNVGSQASWFRASASIIKSIPIFCFAFNVQTTYPLVFAEMNAPKSLTRMDKAVGISFFSCFVVYALCGICGLFYGVATQYLDSNDPTQAGTVPGDALKMYPSGPIDVIMARFCIAISVVGSYTTLHFSARVCFQV